MKRKFGSKYLTAGIRQSGKGAAVLTLSLLLSGTWAAAQVPVDQNGNPIGSDTSPYAGASVENPAVSGDESMTDAELESLVGPIALYPDDLLAIVLPASTYPLEVVQAARYLERVESDTSLEPDEEWDDSIVALLNYPDVLNMMNADLDWTWQLGDAVVRQQSDVILAIESFRDRAYAAGNLKTDERQVVARSDDGVIEIDPVEEDVIYVPYYEPERVVYYSPTPVYHYYPRPYPVYYYPYPTGHYFASSFFWGVTTAFTIGWATDHLHVYHHSYHGHPYYGYRYYYGSSYWRRPSINVYNSWYVDARSPQFKHRYRGGDYWRPRDDRSGARPAHRVVHKRADRTHREQYADRTRRSATDYDFRERQSRAEFDSRVGRPHAWDADRREAERSARRNNTLAATRIAETRARTGARSNNGADRDAIRFRQRGDGAYTASRNARVGGNPDARRGASANAQRSNARRPDNRREVVRTGTRRTGTSPRVGGNAQRPAVRSNNSRREIVRTPAQARQPVARQRAPQTTYQGRSQNRSAAPRRSSAGTRVNRPSGARAATPKRANRISGNRARGKIRNRPRD